ncbi:MAG: hypothetical protein RLZZ419_1260, partial [Pseudomonadota bacterium]
INIFKVAVLVSVSIEIIYLKVYREDFSNKSPE